jgi:hypothetical protein
VLEQESFDLYGDAWGHSGWQAPMSLSAEDVLASEAAGRHYRFRPAPRFFLLEAGTLEDEAGYLQLAAFQRLARLEGMIQTGSRAMGNLALSGPLPRTQMQTAQLQPEAMLDPAMLHGAVMALDALVHHSNNIYIVVRPGATSGFAADGLGRGQRELLLLSRLIEGMQFDATPEAELAGIWELPAGLRMARFFSTTQEVIALFCPSGECDELQLPEVSRSYRIATLDSSNNLVLSPVTMDSLQLGGNALLLIRDI